jgi:hypothetical protein
VRLLWARLRAVGRFLGRELFEIPLEGALSVVGPVGSVGDTTWLEDKLEKLRESEAVESRSGETVVRVELKVDSVPPLSSLRDGVSSSGGDFPSCSCFPETNSLASDSLSDLF